MPLARRGAGQFGGYGDYEYHFFIAQNWNFKTKKELTITKKPPRLSGEVF